MPPKQDLAEMLAEAKIPPKMAQLAKRGKDNTVKKGDPDWIKEIIGVDEEKAVKNLGKLKPPQTYNIGEIESAYARVPPNEDPSHLPKFNIVEGVDVQELHKMPLGQNAVVQVASQFDFQESPGVYDTQVSKYPSDRTQGPLASIQAVTAALHRKAAKRNDKLPHALTNLEGIEDILWNENLYKDGYLQLNNFTSKQKGRLLKALQEYPDALSVLPQWAMCEETGEKQLQVFCAAPSFQGQAQPEEGSVDDQICRHLVVQQYKALAQLAVIRSRETNSVVPLHLTMVGQGAFNNNPSVMRDAMAAVADVVSGENVAVYAHGYRPEDVQLLSDQLAEIEEDKFSIAKLDSGQFEDGTLDSFVNVRNIDIEEPVPAQQPAEAGQDDDFGAEGPMLHQNEKDKKKQKEEKHTTNFEKMIKNLDKKCKKSDYTDHLEKVSDDHYEVWVKKGTEATKAVDIKSDGKNVSIAAVSKNPEENEIRAFADSIIASGAKKPLIDRGNAKDIEELTKILRKAKVEPEISQRIKDKLDAANIELEPPVKIKGDQAEENLNAKTGKIRLG